MKRLCITFFLAISALSASPGSGRATEYYTGNTLLDGCTDASAASSVLQTGCMGYISGVASAGGQCENTINGYRFSVPEGVSRGQLKDIVVMWLQRHPADRHYAAAGMVAAALAESFPCNK